MEQTDPVGVALFGLGRIGSIHLSNLYRNMRVRLLYCVEESSEQIEQALKKWKLLEPETTCIPTSEQERVFQDSRVHAVVICTPSSTHEEIVMRSLASGKAVFCEKPLALDIEGIDRCFKASKKYKRPLLCAFNRRFDPGLSLVKTRVDADEIGRVKVFKTCSRDSPKPSVDYLKISGGIFHDCAVHDIDYICWVLQEYPTSVSAFATAHFQDIRELGDHDTVVIMLKFPSGALATVDLCRQAVYGYDQRVELLGPKGMLTCGEQRPSGVKGHSEKGTTAVPIFYSFPTRYKESYAIEMDHFLDVVQGIAECSVSGEEILAVSKIASACENSARSGKTVSLEWTAQQNGLQ